MKDSLEKLTKDLEELNDIPNPSTSFFDNFKNKLKEQSILALSSIRPAIQEILAYSLPDEDILNFIKNFKKGQNLQTGFYHFIYLM